MKAIEAAVAELEQEIAVRVEAVVALRKIMGPSTSVPVIVAPAQKTVETVSRSNGRGNTSLKRGVNERGDGKRAGKEGKNGHAKLNAVTQRTLEKAAGLPATFTPKEMAAATGAKNPYAVLAGWLAKGLVVKHADGSYEKSGKWHAAVGTQTGKSAVQQVWRPALRGERSIKQVREELATAEAKRDEASAMSRASDKASWERRVDELEEELNRLEGGAQI